MKASTVAVIAALLVCACAVEIPEEDGVLVLSDSNFAEAINAYETLLVEFYAPWCGHCKKLAPEYAKAAAALKKDGLSIAKMDATANDRIPSQFGVEGFPTLKFFRSGKASDYTGGRTESEIVNWVKKKSGPPAKAITTAEDVATFKQSGEVAVIGVFADPASSEAKVFLRVAGANDDIPFAISSSPAVATELGVTAPAIVLFKQFDELRNDFTGPFDEADIAAFVSANALPLVVPFSQKTSSKIFGGKIKTHLLLFVDETESGYDAILADFKQVATACKGKMLAVTVGKGNDRVSQYFGVTAKDQPTAAIVNIPEGSSMKKYLLGSKDVSKASLTSFVTQYTSGALKPHLKSEEVPTSNDGPVTVLVGKNFEAVALDESKDVLVEFYAPWCGHCKKLAPIYDELGEKFSGVKSVVIAKMDATANEVDHPAVNVKGFPTIKFFPAGERKAKVQDYDGPRDLAGLTSFLKANAAIPFALDGDEDAEL